jgi:predicted nucleotidyltransferase
VADVVSQLRDYFAAHPEGVTAAYVFGSVARGTARPDSDVDVAVLFSQAPKASLLEQPFALADELRGLLGRPVDLVVLNTASADLVHRVLRDGVRVFQGDAAARVRFEVQRRNEYFDLLPYLQQYRRRART